MAGRALMVQGTTSHCGKSLLVAALCRIFANRGFSVTPFKAQNMSLNSFVTKDGAEMARAQAFQAFAARVEPTADMNPILLKPKSDTVSQIVLLGRPYRDMHIRDYYLEFALKDGFRGVERSLRGLISRFEIVIIEGAGNPAEVNLYDVDIANMRVAEMADAPVLLLADIDRGGAFASVVGTLGLLRPEHRERIEGIIVNKFRGERSILEPGLRRLERDAGKRVLGVIPYVEGLRLPAEDSVSLGGLGAQRASSNPRLKRKGQVSVRGQGRSLEGLWERGLGAFSRAVAESLDLHAIREMMGLP